MAEKGSCFKDLWDLARCRQVCATGREGGLLQHMLNLDLGQMPSPRAAALQNPRKAGSQGQLGSFTWGMPFAPPDINPHGNATTHPCTASHVLFLLRKRGHYTPAMWHAILRSRLEITLQFHKGFLILQMRYRLPSSHTQCILGCRSRVLNFQRHCVWVRGVTHPPASPRATPCKLMPP